MKTHRLLLLQLIFLSLASGLHAEQDLKLSGLFRNNMVIQRETKAPIWGWAVPDEEIVVTGSWNRKAVRTTTGADGRWTAILDTPEAGGPHKIQVKGESESKTLSNVLSGEVWICGGQSNMHWKMRGFGLKHFADDVEKAQKPQIRLCTIPQSYSLEPQPDTKATWAVCNPNTVLNFSAVGYFFGARLHEELGVPIGLISSSKGGSTAEAWISAPTLRKKFPAFSRKLDTYEPILKKTGPLINSKLPEHKGLNQSSPSLLYNGMIEPLVPFAIRGVIWYQGESNVDNPIQYQTLFPTVIEEWRTAWKQGDFPFYFVQIAPFEYKRAKYPAALLREAQTMALSVPETGMAVTMDIGQVDNIHPKRKKPVGERLARLALARTYQESDIVDSGPMFREMEINRDEAQLSFDFVSDGLKTNDGKKPRHFTIAGSNKVFHPAVATLEGDTVLVSSEKVNKPVAVRFAWGNADDVNLVNSEGLPSPSFRTDDWPIKP